MCLQPSAPACGAGACFSGEPRWWGPALTVQAREVPAHMECGALPAHPASLAPLVPIIRPKLSTSVLSCRFYFSSFQINRVCVLPLQGRDQVRKSPAEHVWSQPPFPGAPPVPGLCSHGQAPCAGRTGGGAREAGPSCPSWAQLRTPGPTSSLAHMPAAPWGH